MYAPALPSPLIGPIAIGVVVTAAAIDLHRRKIPNWLTFGAWGLALPLQMVVQGAGHGALAWAGGWITGFAIFLPLYLLRGMAAGDVKLMAAVGALLGAPLAFEIALATFVIGGVWGLALAMWRGYGRTLIRNMTSIVLSAGQVSREAEEPLASTPASWSVGTLPYGVAIAAGTVGVLFATV